MVALLDVNVLIALLDADHAFHRTAKAFFAENQHHGWATCALTLNGALRILTQPGYTNRFAPATVLDALRTICAIPSHTYWPCTLAITDASCFKHSHLTGPRQVTDMYLLGLAVQHKSDGGSGARLVSFDQTIPLSCVHGAMPGHLVLI